MRRIKKRKIALFDIDGTIYKGSIIFQLTKYQLKEKTISESVQDNFHKNLQLYQEKRVNYGNFANNLVAHWAKGLKGISYIAVLEQTKCFFKNKGNNFFPFFKRIVALLEKTHDIYFVTGEPKFVAQVVAGLYKITGFLSSELEIENGVFTGNIKKFLAKREEKQIAIKELLATHHLKQSFAFGNAEGDIGMLNLVEFPICINPTSGLREKAIKENWQITKPKNVEKIVSSLFLNTL